MQKHVAVTKSGGKQCAISMALAPARPGDSLFVEQASQAGVDQAVFHCPDCHAERGVRQAFLCLSSGKALSLQHAFHRCLFNVPDTGMISIVRARISQGLSSYLRNFAQRAALAAGICRVRWPVTMCEHNPGGQAS